MLWNKKVEMVYSLDESKSSRSVYGRIFHTSRCWTRRLIASALNKIIQNSQFKKKVSLQEQKLGAVHNSYFRLFLITPGESPIRPTSERTLFFRNQQFPTRNQHFPTRNTENPADEDIGKTTRRKGHYQNSISRCITPSSNHSLVQSHFPSKRKCQTRKRIGARLCEARSVTPRPKFKTTRCELTVARCHTGPNVIVRSTWTLRLACLKRRRENAVEEQSSQVQLLKKWTEDYNDGGPWRTLRVLRKAHRGSGCKPLVLKASFTRGVGFRCVMAIAFSLILRLGDMSKMYKFDVRWINKIRLAVAQSFLNCIDAIMSVIRTAFADRSSEVFVSSVAFDESTERLLVRQSGVSSRAAQRSSWHVLVPRKDAQGRKCQRWVNLARAPVPLTGTSAECLMAGSYEVAAAEASWEFQRACLASANFGILHNDRDGAAANMRLLEAHFQVLPETWLLNLIEGSVSLVIDKTYIHRMYSLALMFRMHGCFSRLVLQLEKVRGLRCRHHARPPSRTSCAIRHGARGVRHQQPPPCCAWQDTIRMCR